MDKLCVRVYVQVSYKFFFKEKFHTKKKKKDQKIDKNFDILKIWTTAAFWRKFLTLWMTRTLFNSSQQPTVYLGDVNVQNRLQELEWERYIDDLWQEVVQELDAPAKRTRLTIDGDAHRLPAEVGMNLLKSRTLYGRRTQGLIKRTWLVIPVSRSNSTTSGEEKN